MDLLTVYPPKHFFCVSTDKAANPVNIMGASKRIMEDLVMAYNNYFKVTTARFANVAFSNGSLPDGWIHRLQKKQPLAKRCDDYLSMFGYKINDVKIPNLTGRTNWNYIKTIGCNFEGDIPQMYLNKIKEIFNSGITLWHNPNTMYDYSQNNTIVS